MILSPETGHHLLFIDALVGVVTLSTDDAWLGPVRHIGTTAAGDSLGSPVTST
jgi:hypothetical protein